MLLYVTSSFISYYFNKTIVSRCFDVANIIIKVKMTVLLQCEYKLVDLV